ncbi:MAG TPA: amidohydrolase family protein [Acidimicrobiales bacterium]|nr:amidohydrolase family protein [Acidimicrobiales bacterium]
MIIDIDTHFEPGRSWLDEYPRLAERLPPFSVADATVRAVVGDLLARVPPDQRPSTEALLPPGLAAILGEAKVDGYGFEGSAMHSPGDPVERVAWMDRVGTDAANTICLEGADYASRVDDRDLAREAIHTCNTWLADRVDGHQDRLMPLATIDGTDVDWSIAELTRMRARGSRSFLIDTIPAPGFPPMHERYEPLWSAAEDLGMVAFVHIGHNPASFDPAWANHPDPMVLRQLGVSQGSQSVQLMINGMVFSGVFDRHPNLTLVLAELGLHWFSGMVDHMESRGPALPESAIYLGRYPYELTPTEFVRRNVRITPLPRAHQSPVPLLAQLPECVVFSSDYSHHEGSGDPTRYYADVLAEVAPAVRESFLGGNLAECYARMGDPLSVAATAAPPA